MYSGYNTTSPDVNSIVQAYLARRPDIDPRYFSSFAEILQQSLSTIIQGVYGTVPPTATFDMINREVTNRAFALLDNAVYQMQQRMQPQMYQQQMYQPQMYQQGIQQMYPSQQMHYQFPHSTRVSYDSPISAALANEPNQVAVNKAPAVSVEASVSGNTSECTQLRESKRVVDPRSRFTASITPYSSGDQKFNLVDIKTDKVFLTPEEVVDQTKGWVDSEYFGYCNKISYRQPIIIDAPVGDTMAVLLDIRTNIKQINIGSRDNLVKICDVITDLFTQHNANKEGAVQKLQELLLHMFNGYLLSSGIIGEKDLSFVYKNKSNSKSCTVGSFEELIFLTKQIANSRIDDIDPKYIMLRESSNLSSGWLMCWRKLLKLICNSIKVYNPSDMSTEISTITHIFDSIEVEIPTVQRGHTFSEYVSLMYKLAQQRYYAATQQRSGNPGESEVKTESGQLESLKQLVSSMSITLSSKTIISIPAQLIYTNLMYDDTIILDQMGALVPSWIKEPTNALENILVDNKTDGEPITLLVDSERGIVYKYNLNIVNNNSDDKIIIMIPYSK